MGLNAYRGANVQAYLLASFQKQIVNPGMLEAVCECQAPNASADDDHSERHRSLWHRTELDKTGPLCIDRRFRASEAAGTLLVLDTCKINPNADRRPRRTDPIPSKDSAHLPKPLSHTMAMIVLATSWGA